MFLAIDGGQTSLKAALADASGQVLGTGTGAGLVHLAAEGGEARFVHSVGDAIAGAFAAAGLAQQPVEAIALGLTGVEQDSAEAACVAQLLTPVIAARRVMVRNDAQIALAGAHAGGAGIIAISGTGSIVLGRDAHGREHRVGGWGWLVGDEGSALAIGRNGLRAALADADRAGPPTRLRAAFLAHFGIAGYGALKAHIYAPGFGARGFAALAVVVSDAARHGDAVAQHIIAGEAAQLADAVRACAAALALAHPRVAPMSGGFENIHGLRPAFAQALAGAADVVAPQLDALGGALMLARLSR